MITTTNLELVPFCETHYEAIKWNDNETLGSLLNITRPASWTENPDAIHALPVLYQFFVQLQGDTRWGSYFIVHTADRQLIGSGGFKGLPDQEGFVEMGYEIRADYRRRGYASETARALIAFAFSQPGIRGVRAHTLAEQNYSVQLLRNCGMRFKGTIVDPDDGEL